MRFVSRKLPGRVPGVTKVEALTDWRARRRLVNLPDDVTKRYGGKLTAVRSSVSDQLLKDPDAVRGTQTQISTEACAKSLWGRIVVERRPDQRASPTSCSMERDDDRWLRSAANRQKARISSQPRPVAQQVGRPTVRAP